MLHGGLAYGGGSAEIGCLLEKSHFSAEPPCDAAAVGAFLAAYDTQQSGFACAVARHDACFVAFFHAESDVGEKNAVAVAFCEILYLQYAGHILKQFCYKITQNLP